MRNGADKEGERLTTGVDALRQRTDDLAQTLARERSIFQAVIEHTNTQLAYLDPQFNFVWVNTAYARGSGHSKEELIGRDHFELFPNPENQAIFEQVRDTGQPVEFHARPFAYVDQPERGTTYWDWTLVPIKDASGQVGGLVLSLSEVTEQVRAEEERNQHLARMDTLVAQLETTINAIADGVVIYGPGAEILHLNPAAQRLLGYSPDERERPIAERAGQLRVLASDGEPFTSLEDLLARRALCGETVRNAIMALWDIHSGGYRWVSASAAPVRAHDGNLLGAVASFTDITALREARDELELRVREQTAELAAANEVLRESEERFRRLAENARDIIFRIRMAPTRGFEYVSPAATEITGYTPEEHYADPDLGFKLVHPDDRPLLEALTRIESAVLPPLVLRWVRKDGGIIWTEQRNVPIFDEAGDLVALEGIARDITHRVQMATALRESEERFRHAFEYAPFGMALVGTDGRFLQVNALLCRLLGYAEPELLGTTFGELTFPGDLEGGLDLFENLLAGKRDHGWLEKRYVRKDGHVIWTHLSTSMVRDAEGAPLYLISQIQDITERKQNEEALWQQAQVINQIHDSVIVTDLDGYVTSWNRGAERLTGYSRGEVLGRHISFLYPEDQQTFLREQVIAPLQAKGLHEVEVLMHRKSGQELYVHLSLSLLRNAEGAVIGMIGYGMDITARKQAEQAAQQYIRRLETLQKIDRAILSAQSPAEITAAVLHHFRELSDLCTGANLVLFDLENQRGTVLATDAGRRIEFGPGTHFPLELAGDFQGLRQGKVYVVDDVQAIPQPSLVLRTLQASGLRSYMCVPLVVQGNLVGSLNLRSDLPGAFTPEEAEVASEVAHSLAIAIQQARLFEQVRDSNERLRGLSRRLSEAQEEERRRLARELHDEIGQTLTAVKINLQTIQRLANSDVLAPQMEESIAIVERALQQVRGLSLDLRPLLLDDLGLVATLRWHVDRQAQSAGFKGRFQAEPPEMHLPPELEITCFRVVQEALTNVMRHAQAQEVDVQLRRQEGELELSVRDDGVGFDVQAALDNAVAGASLGLLGMQERVLRAGGQIDIVSAPGCGTEIRVRFRLAR